jgi:hypothetical protein
MCLLQRFSHCAERRGPNKDQGRGHRCHRNAEDSVRFVRPLQLRTAILFGICWWRGAGAAGLVRWNGDICNRHGLASTGKGNSCVSIDRIVLCDGSMCSNLFRRSLAWEPRATINCIHCNRIHLGTANLWIARADVAPHASSSARQPQAPAV